MSADGQNRSTLACAISSTLQAQKAHNTQTSGTHVIVNHRVAAELVIVGLCRLVNAAQHTAQLCSAHVSQAQVGDGKAGVLPGGGYL